MGTNKAPKRTPERGQYGNTRGKERQRRRADNRARDPRYTAAMEETRRHQEELDALMADQAANPAVGETEGAAYAARLEALRTELAAAQAAQEEIEATIPEPVVTPPTPIQSGKFSTRRLRQVGEEKFPFAGMTARMMLRAGYHVKYVMEYTGMGYEHLDDIIIDDEGYGMTKERIAAEEAEDENSSSSV